MTLFSYEIFDAVARQGSFNKAAQQLHLTPSAISHAIAVMEAELGFTLFNRGKNGVTMTSYGASLYPSIRRSEERRVGKECRSRWSPYH